MMVEGKSLADSLNWLNLVGWVLWALLLVGIPITSFPPIAELISDGISVSPFSMLPLVLLIPVWLIQGWSERRGFSFLIWPIILLLMVALGSSVLAWFRPMPAFKGQTIFSRELRALSTLAVGAGFYFVASSLPRSSKAVKLSLALIYLGGILALVWSTVQAEYVLRGLNNVPQELNEIHRLFSIRDLERNRVTGLAFEPSWLGDQIVVLYLPLWLGALLKRQTLLPWRIGVVSLEAGLLLWSGWILIMTRSRVSWLAMLLLLTGLTIYAFWRLSSVIVNWAVSRVGWGRLALLPFRFVFLAFGIALVVLLGYFMLVRTAEIDWRMRRALRLPTEIYAIRDQHPYSSLYEVANRFAFAERVVYWRAGLKPFEQYPVAGIGLGNAGFSFRSGVPAYGHGLSEIRAMMDPNQPSFPNPKNLWIRLASETGILGFGLYFTWLILLTRLAIGLARSHQGLSGWIGIAGILSLGSQVVEGLSLDTFALPQIWIMNGLLTAMISIVATPEVADPEEPVTRRGSPGAQPQMPGTRGDET